MDHQKSRVASLPCSIRSLKRCFETNFRQIGSHRNGRPWRRMDIFVKAEKDQYSRASGGGKNNKKEVFLRSLYFCSSICAQSTSRIIICVQEEARKALQGLFQGKKDLLAAYDPGLGSGGAGRGGGKKGTGGSGDEGKGSNWQGPEWRNWSFRLWKRIGHSLRALLAVLGFVGTSSVTPIAPHTYFHRCLTP